MYSFKNSDNFIFFQLPDFLIEISIFHYENFILLVLVSKPKFKAFDFVSSLENTFLILIVVPQILK